MASPIQIATRTLTDAQIKALPTTAVQIAPAPGANLMIYPMGGTAKLNATAGAYAADLGSTWQLLLGTQEYSGLIEAEAMLENAAITVALFPQFVGINAVDGYLTSSGKLRSAVTDQALNIKDDYNGVVDYTGGNAANTLVVTVFYIVLAI